jgi:GMP synthase (glutamine-hydrolysing)
MSLNILIVEGNNPENSEVFKKIAKSTCSENLKNLVVKLEPAANIKIINPGREEETAEALKNMSNYNGIIFTGGAMRINDMTDEIKKHINFASNCFKFNNKILAICWGLQICVTAGGGKVAPGKNGAHIGIASDVIINEDGKKNLIYKNKTIKFNTPAYNFDEVCKIPDGAKILSSDKVNNVMAVHFKSSNSEIWGLQYHPDYEYWQMVNLANERKYKMIENEYFKNENEFQNHIDYIQEEDKKLDFQNRTCEVKNWLKHINLN